MPHSTPLRLVAAADRGVRHDQQSSNWSGVADTSSHVRFTSIAATWQVPPVVRAPGAKPQDTFSSTWVGIGGDLGSDPTLIQAGTEQDLDSDGLTSYSAWYELLPQASVTIHGKVNAGDTVTVSITEDAASKIPWTISFADATQGWTFTKNLMYSSQNASAEWIEEAPTIGIDQATMADFQSVTLSSLSVNGADTLVPSGVTESRIDYVSSGGTVLAYPEGYDAAADSMAITYGTPTALALGTLPDAREGAPYSASLAASGGLSPYAFEVTGGLATLPAGLAYDTATGAISGTPTATGTAELDVTVDDDGGHSVSGVVPLSVPGPTLTLVQGAPTTIKVAAGGGLRVQLAQAAVLPPSLTGPVRYVTTTSSSKDLTVSSTGVVSDAAATPIGEYRASGTDGDAFGDAGTWSVTVQVEHPRFLVVVTAQLPAATVAKPYVERLVAFGPSGSPAWHLAKGASLPRGLSLSTGGLLSGKPTAKGVATIRCRVTDAGQSRTVTYHLRIA